MLVLSRKLNQSIIVGDNVKIQILKISGNSIRIGIEAPHDVKILRGELAPYDVDVKTPQADRQCLQQEQNDSLMMEFELDSDDLTQLPNPFVVAQAS